MRSPIFIFIHLKSGKASTRMFLNFTSYQQMSEYVSKAMGKGLENLVQFPRGPEVCTLSPCADWLWYPTLPPVPRSPKLQQPKHDADQLQFSVSSCPLTCFQAMVLGHTDIFCPMFQSSVGLIKHKFLFHILIVLHM
jgi:hypothetical protein